MDTVDVPGDHGQHVGGLNSAVSAAIAAGTLSNIVFRLEPNGRYILDSTIVVPAGTWLTIIAPEPGKTQETAPPVVIWDSSGSVYWSYNFDCFGNITLKNIRLLYATTAGYQSFTSLKIEDSPDTINGQRGVFENVVFDYAALGGDASGAVSVTSRHFRGTFRNCYFKNCIDQTFTIYGRALSFPFTGGTFMGWHIDSLLFEHCTFANMGIVYSQESGHFADVVRINHCTFLNVITFPLRSGWWKRLSVTNSLYVNTFLWGYFQYPNNSMSPVIEGGTLRIDSISTFGFPVSFAESDRHILFSHSSYCVEEWLREYMAAAVDPYMLPNGVRPQPMLSPGTLAFFDTAVNGVKSFPYMNRAHLYDSTDPGFQNPPTDREALKTYLWMNWTSGADTNWAYRPQDDIAGVWPLKEDLSYSNPTLLTAGMGNFPLGDLYHWFPDLYPQWKGQSETESTRITSWLSTGIDPQGTDAVAEHQGTGLPQRFELSQNYPNPVNPKTVISVQWPVTSVVRLAVYDLLGREVALLANGQYPAGKYLFRFDGSKFASGVYLYRLTAGGHTAVRKMTLIK